MFKTFAFGIVLGAIATGAFLHFVPMVDQYKEWSIVSVQPNGGSRESFYVNLPSDRILAGHPGTRASVPPSLEWPNYDFLTGVQTEMFKVRDADDNVVGVASRVAADGEASLVEWVLHMPARGSMYLTMGNDPDATGNRSGRLRAGTREFELLNGSVTERYVTDPDAAASGIDGRLELVTMLVGADEPTDVAQEDAP